MGILENARAATVVCTRNRDRAVAFYRDTLGLSLTSVDQHTAVFSLGGSTLRISTVLDWTPHEHTILGFCVADVPATVKALREKGVSFQKYGHIPQDELGVCTLPGGMVRVAWFRDPDGNVMSVTNA